MSKVLYLYKKYGDDVSGQQNIYELANRKLVAVDINYYDTKKKRLNIQEQLKLKSFFITQSIFTNIVCKVFLEELKVNAKIVDVEFDENLDNEENNRLFSILSKLSADEFVEFTSEMARVNDAIIYSIKFTILGEEFELNKNGLLSVLEVGQGIDLAISNNDVADLYLGV